MTSAEPRWIHGWRRTKSGVAAVAGTVTVKWTGVLAILAEKKLKGARVGIEMRSFGLTADNITSQIITKLQGA